MATIHRFLHTGELKYASGSAAELYKSFATVQKGMEALKGKTLKVKALEPCQVRRSMTDPTPRNTFIPTIDIVKGHIKAKEQIEEVNKQKEEAESRSREEQQKREEEERLAKENEQKRREEEAERQRLEAQQQEKRRLMSLCTRKDDWESFLQVLQENDIRYFYHFTDERNIPSIKEHGGLYSWFYCSEHNIQIPNSGGDQVSRSLDNRHGLQDYVRLSFCDDHPMMYRLSQSGCVLRLLKIKIDVALWKGVLFSNMNATDSNHIHGASLDHLRNVKFSATKKHYVNNNDPDFKYHQAEVMVKTFIPLEYIENL